MQVDSTELNGMQMAVLNTLKRFLTLRARWYNYETDNIDTNAENSQLSGQKLFL